MYALVAGLVASPRSIYYSAATTADNLAWHMGVWISQFRVSGFDIENGHRPLGYLGLGYCGTAGDAASYLLYGRRRGLHREGGEIAKPRRIILGVVRGIHRSINSVLPL